MATTETVPDRALRPWGYVATALWALLAAVVSIAASLAALALFFPDALRQAVDPVSDMRLFSVVGLTSFAAVIAVLVAAARLKGWPSTDYFALVLPSRRETIIAFAAVAAFTVGYDLLTHVLSRDIVTPFQVDAYSNARDSGAVAALVLLFVIAAPVGEEIVFRGFLFRGWVHKPRDFLPAIVLTSAIWAALHSQYDWYGIVQIFCLGLVLGWVRWRSGSTLLTILLHAGINAWATVQTAILVDQLMD